MSNVNPEFAAEPTPQPVTPTTAQAPTQQVPPTTTQPPQLEVPVYRPAPRQPAREGGKIVIAIVSAVVIALVFFFIGFGVGRVTTPHRTFPGVYGYNMQHNGTGFGHGLRNGTGNRVGPGGVAVPQGQGTGGTGTQSGTTGGTAPSTPTPSS